MATVEAGLAQYLLQGAGGNAGRVQGLTDLRALVERRVYPSGKVPTKETGARLTYQRISTDRTLTLSGDDGLCKARVQVNCYGGENHPKPYKIAKDVADAARRSLKRFRGSLGGCTVQMITLMDERDEDEKPHDAGERPDSWVSLDFGIWFEET